ncbi:MAG TPA: type III PLP-dependent enzyme [Chloroflexota bacterium]|nr:type III PLP-dependent enzyme [Chloroflexota bacterium]
MRLYERIGAPRRLELTPETLERARQHETPFLLVDRRIVRANFRALRAATGADVHYAVKANPDTAILAALAEEGAGFEVASAAELRAVLGVGVAADRIVSSNPVKKPDFLRLAHAVGMRRFAFDSSEELRKLELAAPGCGVYCRVAVDNSGSDWPLSRKHGAQPGEVAPLLVEAAERGLDPFGITFHVGSQCLSVRSWRDAMLTAAELWDAAARRGVRLGTLNLGGGFPVQHLKAIPELGEIGELVRALFRDHFPADAELTVEPGRAVVGSAAILVTSVIGKARRGDEDWLYLDAGVFNGLLETIGGFQYELRAERPGPTRAWTVAGPSCDSVDTMQSGVELPELSVGDRVYVMNAGAYTLSYASSFNGFGPPEIYLVEG